MRLDLDDLKLQIPDFRLKIVGMKPSISQF